eukprot:c29_g1_i1.p1 GENE.c29_g1_i1~~c29_g1_i1.p1  ORF type:complete len:679 (+),score=97.75 c29_g1_i1:52-2037(+)
MAMLLEALKHPSVSDADATKALLSIQSMMRLGTGEVPRLLATQMYEAKADEIIAQFMALPFQEDTRKSAMTALGRSLIPSSQLALASVRNHELLRIICENLDSDQQQISSAAMYLITCAVASARDGCARPRVIIDSFLPVAIRNIATIEFTEITNLANKFICRLAEDPAARPAILSSGVVDSLFRIVQGQQNQQLSDNLCASLALALLVGDSEDHFAFAATQSLSYRNIVHALECCNSNEPLRQTTWRPQISAVMRAIESLGISDRNKKLLIDAGILPCVVAALFNSPEAGGRLSTDQEYDFDCLPNILSLIWSLSFDPQGAEVFQKHSRLVSLLREWVVSPPSVSTQTNAGSPVDQRVWSDFSQNIQEASECILFVLFNETSHIQQLETPDAARKSRRFSRLTPRRASKSEAAAKNTPTKSAPKYVLLSFSRKDQRLVTLINEELTKQGVTTCMNIPERGSSALGTMVKSIADSTAVVVFLSDPYKKSNFCRTEALYAQRKELPMIPVLLQPQFRPTAWLGTLLPTQNRFDFTNPSNMSKVIPGLVEAIRQNMNTSASRAPPSPASPNSFAVATLMEPLSRLDFKTWTCSDVVWWMGESDLGSETANIEAAGIDGECLESLRDFQPHELVNFCVDRLKMPPAGALKFRLKLSKLWADFPC